MKLSFISTALLALAATTSAGAAPVASGLAASQTFQAYTGAAAVGNGLVNTSDVLWFVEEGVANDLKSWFIFFDPSGSQSISATLVFDRPIVDVITDRVGLFQSQSTYGVDIDHDGNFNDYLNPAAVGLEAAQDAVVWSPGTHTLLLRWTASNPGDHIRVLVQANDVPEPASWGLAGVALAALAGTRMRRRRKA